MAAGVPQPPIGGRKSGVSFAAILVVTTLFFSMFETHQVEGGVVAGDSGLDASDVVRSTTTTTTPRTFVASVAVTAEIESNTISIEDFSNPTMEWRTMNDPVMGGRSKSSVVIENGMAHFEGTCAIVPFLEAPGFITMTTGDHSSGFLRGLFSKQKPSLFPDVSSCEGLSLNLRSTVDYDGYYVSFGTDRAPGGRHAVGYKTPLTLSDSSAFVDLKLPFSEFSNNWDDATGRTKVTCLEDSRFCPSVATLRDMKTISIWGEGIEGNIALDIRRIGAYGCTSSAVSDGAAAAPTVVSSASLLSGETMDGTMGMVIAPCAILAVLGAVFLVGKRRTPSASRDGYQEVGSVEEAALLA